MPAQSLTNLNISFEVEFCNAAHILFSITSRNAIQNRVSANQYQNGLALIANQKCSALPVETTSEAGVTSSGVGLRDGQVDRDSLPWHVSLQNMLSTPQGGPEAGHNCPVPSIDPGNLLTDLLSDLWVEE